MLIDTQQAWQIIAGEIAEFTTEEVDLVDSCGRVLRQQVIADRDQPAFHRVTMDGIAIDYAAYQQGASRFILQGVQPAGSTAPILESDTHCWQVMTGAVLPQGCDTVIPIEDVAGEKIQDIGEAVELNPDVNCQQGQFIHRQGSDYQKDVVLLSPGITLKPPEIAVLASVGVARVTVSYSPSITVVTTGDELVTADKTPQPHQIRDANGNAITSALKAKGFHKIQRLHLTDNREVMYQQLSNALADSDVLILSGSVSKGKFDFLPAVMTELGVECQFHGVKQRPGKPLWFGRRPDGLLVFALPGNPVSTLMCLYRYVCPALIKASAGHTEPEQVMALGNLPEGISPSGFTRFLPVTLAEEDRSSVACIKTFNTSGDFFGLAGTAGFIEIPADRQPSQGDVVRYFPW